MKDLLESSSDLSIRGAGSFCSNRLIIKLVQEYGTGWYRCKLRVTFFSKISPYRTEFFSGRPHDQMEKHEIANNCIAILSTLR